MNNGNHQKKRVTHQRDIAAGSNASSLTLSLVLSNVTNFDQWLNLVLFTTTTRGVFINVFFVIIVTTKPRDIRQLASQCSQIMAGVYYAVTLAT